MTPQEIIANMLHDFAIGFWEGATMPLEMLAEFQGVRPGRVSVTPAGDVRIGNRPMTPRRLSEFVAWLNHEYPWVSACNDCLTIPTNEERRAA